MAGNAASVAAALSAALASCPRPPARALAGGSRRSSALAASTERTVVCAETGAWLAQQASLPSVVTSLPDVTELLVDGQERGAGPYCAWFRATVRTITSKLRPGCVALFYQTSTQLHGELIDKAFLVLQGVADVPNARVLWRKCVLRSPVGTARTAITPGYSDLVAVAREQPPAGVLVLPDVFERGEMAWSRAMGASAALAACRYVSSWGCTEVLDPFCGSGTVLAAANYCGIAALGVDLSPKRTRHAAVMQLVLAPDGSLHPRRSTDRSPLGGEEEADETAL
jgi:hypothetical protein